MQIPQDIAILGYGAYIPRYRLPTTEVGRVWKGAGKGPNVEKALAGLDEDSATMAVESAQKAVEMAEVDDLGAIFVGTETKPYVVKSTGTIVAQVLGQSKTLAADLEFACKAGTEAIQMIMGLVGSGMIKNGLAIGADTAQGRPGDELEYTAASASAAYIISKKTVKSIAQIEGSTSYISDTTDFWRRQHEKYPRHLSRFTGEPAYFHHTQQAVQNLFEEFECKASDFEYAVFHQPNPRFPVEVAHRLGFNIDQIRPGLLSHIIGNPYAANSLLSLAAVLEECKPGDRIMMCSYGSGSGSDAMSIKVLDGIERIKNATYPRIKDMIKDTIKVDYATYSKFRNCFNLGNR